MKIITIGSLKGGVGKTNFTFNLSCFLALEKDKRILLIDLDPQGNLTQCCQLNPHKSLASDLFLKENLEIDSIICKTNFNKINIVPTNILMADLEIKLSSQFGREFKLRNIIDKNFSYLKNNYDYIIIDTNPSLNITNVNAYSVANNIIIVSDNSIHSWRAVETIFKMWEAITKSIKIKNNITAIVLSNFDHYTISKDFTSNLNDSNLNKFLIKQEIRKKQKYKLSEITGIPIVKTLKPIENPYFDIVNELEQKGVL